MIEGKPLRHIVRAENVQAYSPANHLETQNRRLIGPETVGAKNIEIVLGVVSSIFGLFSNTDCALFQFDCVAI